MRSILAVAVALVLVLGLAGTASAPWNTYNNPMGSTTYGPNGQTWNTYNAPSYRGYHPR
jgi:hypothetical protein